MIIEGTSMTKKQMTFVSVIFACGLALSACGETAPPFKSDMGPNKITFVDTIELEDADREKTLLVQATFPEGEGSYPLIIFSHGAMCAKNTYGPIVDHWVSHGYVVIEPTHQDSETLGKVRFSDLAWIADSRPGDMSLILDQLDIIAEKVPGLAGKIDANNVAAAGHSMGAATAMRATGLKSRNSKGEAVDMSDDRFDIALLLSSPGKAPYTPEEAWGSYTTPMFASTGTRDVTMSNKNKPEGWKWRLGAYDLTPAGDKYISITQDMDHFLGGLICHAVKEGGPDPEALSYVGAVTTAFLDSYLKGDMAARSTLDHAKISKLTNDRMELRSK
jgi:hypothetical protein